MQMRQIMMTPEYAKSLLAGNEGNRKIRDYWTTEIAKMINEGAWKLTHQAVAVSKTGRLLDGQHRLHGIIKSGKSVPIYVAEDCDDDIFMVTDKGIKRSLADSLGKDKKITETLAYLLMLANYRADRPDLVQRLLDTEYGYASELLMKVCNKPRRIASSTPVKAGAVLQMAKTGKFELIAENYRKFVLLDYDVMPKPLLQLEKQIASGAFSPNDRWWVFCRAYRSFEPFGREDKAIRMTEASKQLILEDVREDIQEILRG